MTLHFQQIVKREENVRSFIDRRRRVTRVIASYHGEDGHEYRRSFEAYGEPIVPANIREEPS